MVCLGFLFIKAFIFLYKFCLEEFVPQPWDSGRVLGTSSVSLFLVSISDESKQDGMVCD